MARYGHMKVSLPMCQSCIPSKRTLYSQYFCPEIYNYTHRRAEWRLHVSWVWVEQFLPSSCYTLVTY